MQINTLEYLDGTAAKYGEKIAYCDETEALTFEQVHNYSLNIGSALLPVTKKNSPVIVISEKSIFTILLYLGVLQAGCYYIPIDKDLPVSRIKTILSLVESEVLLTDSGSASLAESLEFHGTILYASDILESTPLAEALEARRATIIDTDPAYVIFTSGSTGVPKGVIGSHRSLIDYIDEIVRVSGIGPHDILGNQSPLDYIAGIRDIYIPLKTGAATNLIPKKHFSMPAQVFDYLDNHEITTIYWVSTALSICAEFDVFKYKTPETLQKIVFTGSVLPSKHLRYWQEHLPGRLFINQYGPTEITASCTWYRVDHLVEPDETLPIGIPFRNTEIILLDDNNRPAAPGEQGEICVRGTCLSLGYFKNPEKTAEAFVQNPLNNTCPELIYRTGDLGYIAADGNLFFSGRKDNQIKHMGHRVELSEIENTAMAMPGIDQCVSLYHTEKQNIYLFYKGNAEAKAITIFFRERLPGFMAPRKLVRLDEFPFLFNGKIDKAALKNMMG